MPNKLKKSALTAQLKNAIHDLNNIFTSSLNSIDALEKIVANDKSANKLVSTIKNNSLRAVDIISGLSENSKKQKINISIKELAEDVKSTIKPTISKNIKLKFSYGKNLSLVRGHYSDLYRALLNILVNSSEAIKNEGVIAFSAKNSRKKDNVILSIRDTGKGISHGKLQNIFDAGYSSKNKKSNSGLGLSIVKKIIFEHSGTIDVSSQLNNGTEFIIILQAIPNPITPKFKDGRNIKILLADDDKTILELFSDLLISYNYEVVTASDGKSAFNKFKKGDFDLVVIDKIMPNLDGLECIDKIRTLDKKIPIILTTGSQEALDRDKLNISRLVKKPWGFNEMLEVIQTLHI